jgi:pimeloyl-ACP methyl ester carboxylesterase
MGMTVAPISPKVKITTMKNYYLLSIAVLFFTASCKKSLPENTNKTMPVAMVTINQKLTEVSKTIGSTPSIVLIGGFGSELSTWKNLYAVLNNGSAIFTYNRAGIGGSENISGIRDAKAVAVEMKIILEANNIHPPYVLVAHSMGGIYARMFYHLNPGKVKGIVLVDATHENQLDSLLSMIPQPDRNFAYASMVAVNDSILNTYPAGSEKEEFRANFATNYTQIRQYPAITAIPVCVITSTKVSESNPPFVVDIQKALHQQWAVSAGVNGKFVETNKSGHYIHVEEPGLVADGIRWVLSK